MFYRPERAVYSIRDAWYNGVKYAREENALSRCLYVSDLDGTLLRSNETVSPYTCDVVNRLTEKGMIFSYATARSFHTSKKVTRGLDARLPLIVYNGAITIDSETSEILTSNYFGNDVHAVLEDLFAHDIWPIVYAFIDGREYFSFIPDKTNPELMDFLNTRRGDSRWREAKDTEELAKGDLFYITCIDRKEKLLPLYERYRTDYHAVCQEDIYSGATWLEIMPAAASKANAILQLKQKLGCDRVISFGDALNDLDMFRISDECYAVENAMPALKEAATAVIAGNNEDGVAHWLEENVRFE